MSKNGYSSQNREVRGLFVLGLLAVLSAIRIQHTEIIVEIGQRSFDLIPWIDITIILWSLYAFFMVLGLSEDLVGKLISSSFRELSIIFLGLNYALLVLLSLLAFVRGFLPRIPYFLILMLILACYVASIKLRKQEKPSKTELRKWWKSIKSNTPQVLVRVLMFIFWVCVILTIFAVEKYVIPSVIIGCVAIVSYIVLKEKVKSE